MPENRYTDSHPDRREHCTNHDHHTDAIEENSRSLAGIFGSVSALKWIIGLGIPVSIAVFTTGIAIANSRMTDITNELKEIKSAVHAIAMDQVKVTAEIEGLKWRVDQLEAK